MSAASAKIPSVSKMAVGETLDLDQTLREPRAMRPLFTLLDIEPHDFVADKMLVIPSDRRGFNLDGYVGDDIAVAFHDAYSVFNDAGISFDNILVAGGAMCNLLCGTPSDTKDIDIFFYGLESTDAATARLTQIVKQLERYAAIHGLEVQVRLSANLTAVVMPKINLRVELIPRLYKDPAEILYGFDIGSCAVGFNGKEAVFSLMGRFAFSTGLNVVDHTRRSTTYGARMYKYYKRGFGVVMPLLPAELRFLSQWDNYWVGRDFCITWHDKYVLAAPNSEWECASDYDVLKSSSTHTYSRAWNVLNAYADAYAQNPTAVFYFTVKNFSKTCDVCTHLAGKVGSESLKHQAVCSIIRKSMDDTLDQCINFLGIETFTREHAKVVIPSERAKLYIAILRDCWDERYAPILQEENRVKIHWITENPGTQISSSRNPVVSDPVEWWGPCMWVPSSMEWLKIKPDTAAAATVAAGGRKWVVSRR